MKKIIQNSIFLVFSSLFFISCSVDDLESINHADYNAKMLDVFIYDSDLVGEWKINSMVVNKDIDLNGDGNLDDNLLLETTCFENMVYTFKGDKTFTIINPTLELTNRDDKDEFNCQTPTILTGKWSIKDDMLILYIRRNGPDFEERKHLILIEDIFYLEVNKDESRQFINDKGNSSATGLTVVALEFKRTAKKL